MADAATEFLLNNLKEVVAHHAGLIKNAEGNIQQLEMDLTVFQAFLRDTVKTRKENHRIRDMVKKIHDVVYDVEDIIDVFVTKTVENNRRSQFVKFFINGANLHDIGAKVQPIRSAVESLRRQINVPSINQDKDDKPDETRPPRKKDVVGFVKEAEYLVGRVLQDTDDLDVISVIGMFGLGKTTLAWKVFTDKEIGLKFPIRIWITVSQKFTVKEMFLNILKELDVPLDENMRAKDSDKLADIVSQYLIERRFLMVVDDVWSADDWDKLKVVLPKNHRGKVLMTSRNEKVGKAASKPRPPYNLRKFEKDESWELFRLEALGKLECPLQLEKVGRKIAENCDGLPLAIVVIGGILSKSVGTNLDATEKEWERVSNDVSSYLAEEDDSKRIRKFISLSYDNLPYHLRACFLYLGLFPEDYEIPASRLIRMWIGEGFIPQKVGYTLEETGEKYLEELISRNLAKSVKFKADGKVKTCQIHDTLREFCRTEAETENFLQEIKYNSDEQRYVPSISNIDTYRRLSIHSNCLDFISTKLFGPRVRTFVCFAENKYEVSPEDTTKIIGAFKLLRVLDALPFKFATIDSDLYKLLHMRYIALSFKSAVLPSKFDKLSNIQTLIIDTTSGTLEVKADIWKMKHLRHFKTKACATLPKPIKREDSAKQLQTLGLISVESCTKELPTMAPNLKKLGIRGKLALLFGTSNAPFDNLGNMKRLGKLKLVNDANPELEATQLPCLPRYDRFPSGLTSLTLCATFLSWKHISTLGSLENLEVLKLKNRAFMGETWKVHNGGFPALQFLHIEDTDLADWETSSDHYPKLRSLVLKNCINLKKVPFITSLQMLNLYNCILANESAREIAEVKKPKTPAGNSEFMLVLYPAV